jgi:hypothetical protein
MQVFNRVFDTPCKRITTFKSWFLHDLENAKESYESTDCESCGDRHMLFTDEEGVRSGIISFERNSHLRKAISSAIAPIYWEKGHMRSYRIPSKFSRRLLQAFSIDVLDQLERLNQARRDAGEAKKKNDETRKRFLVAMIPALGTLSEADFEANIPSKFVRLSSKADLAFAERICATPANDMSRGDVIRFARYLETGL